MLLKVWFGGKKDWVAKMLKILHVNYGSFLKIHHLGCCRWDSIFLWVYKIGIFTSWQLKWIKLGDLHNKRHSMWAIPGRISRSPIVNSNISGYCTSMALFIAKEGNRSNLEGIFCKLAIRIRMYNSQNFDFGASAYPLKQSSNTFTHLWK